MTSSESEEELEYMMPGKKYKTETIDHEFCRRFSSFFPLSHVDNGIEEVSSCIVNSNTI